MKRAQAEQGERGRSATPQQQDLLAVLDLGTNNCRLLIAAPAARGGTPGWGVCAAILTVFLLLLALSGPGPLGRLRWRALVYARALTYPFYLVHQSLGIPVVRGLLKAVPALGLVPAIALGLCFSLALSAALNHLVDRRLGAWLRRHLTADFDATHDPVGRPAPPPDPAVRQPSSRTGTVCQP